MDMLIGIDLGTTVLKAAAFDARSGAALAQAARRLEVDAAADGRREQDPRAIDVALLAVMKEIRRELGAGAWRGVRGLGMAAQGGSTIIVNRATGRPLTRMILWNDARAYPLLPAIAARRPGAWWRGLTLRDDPGAGLARLVWLRKYRPALLRPANLYAGAGEYLYFQMTGLWRQDAGNALQIGCYNARKRDLDRRPADLVGTDVSFFAPMRQGHELHPLAPAAARRLGLSPDVQVAGPYMDHEAGYLSAVGACQEGVAPLACKGCDASHDHPASRSRAASKPWHPPWHPPYHPLQCSLGTAWVGNFVVPDEPKGFSPIQLVLPAPVGEGELVVQPLLTGNVTWDWALRTLVHADHDKALAGAAKVFEQELLPPRGLTFLPWLARPNPLDAGALGGGAFFGVGAHTTPAEMLRAVASGMCYELQRVLEAVAAGGAVDGVVLGGGASRGRYFQTLLAALFHPLPVWSLAEEDLSGTRGAVFAFSRRAARAPACRVPLPHKALRERIAQGRQAYRRLYERLYADVHAGEAYRLTARGGRTK